MAHLPVTSIANLLLRSLIWLNQRVRADHASLNGGWYTSNLSGGRSRFYLSAACAPSRAFRAPRPVAASEAHGFFERVLGSSFDSTPDQSTREMVRFEVSPPEGGLDPLRAATVSAGGRVEIFVACPHTVREDGSIALSAEELFGPLFLLARSVETGEYRQLYGLRTRLRRLDWYVNVTPAISGDKGWTPWDDLEFPGLRPRTRAKKPNAAMSIFGLGYRELRSSRQRRSSDELLRVVLDEYLTDSGWDGTDDAIDGVIRSIRARK